MKLLVLAAFCVLVVVGKLKDIAFGKGFFFQGREFYYILLFHRTWRNTEFRKLFKWSSSVSWIVRFYFIEL